MGDLIKRREVVFCTLHPDTYQPHSAAFLLNDLEGILSSYVLCERKIHITYDVATITLELIEELLAGEGFHLDNSLMTKLKRAIIYYSEEVQRENLERDNQDSRKKAALEQYQKREHGCRDHRPDHWRRYL